MGDDTSERRLKAEISRYSGVGLQFAATIGFFAWVGWWLDGKWGSAPWLLLVGVFTGFGLGLYSMIRKLLPQTTPRRRDAPDKDPR